MFTPPLMGKLDTLHKVRFFFWFIKQQRVDSEKTRLKIRRFESKQIYGVELITVEE